MRNRSTERLRGSRIDLGLILLLAAQVAGLVYLGLAPFSFSPRNRVERLSEKSGLAFDTTGIATSRGSLGRALQFPNDSISIHLLIEPNDEPRGGLGTILSIEDDDHLRHLIIAQWKSWLVIRVRDPSRSSRGYWEIGAEGFHAGETHLVTVTSGPTRGTAIYVDGVATGDTLRRSVITDNEPFEGRLLLGCLGNGSAGWRGSLLGLAIGSTVLSPEQIAAQHRLVLAKDFSALRVRRSLVALYDFAGLLPRRDGLSYSVSNRVEGSALDDLEIPATFTPLHPEIFGVPRLRDMKADWFLRDLIRNIAGFVPLGFVSALILIRNRNTHGYAITLQVALVGAALSFGIESVQIALPMRSSSLSDLTLNVIGTTIGAVIGLGLRHTSLGSASH